MLGFLLETINKLRAEQKTRSALMRAIFTAEKFRNISLVSTLAILRRCRRIISRRSRNTASQQHAEYFERLNRFFARVNRQREREAKLNYLSCRQQICTGTAQAGVWIIRGI
jgi:hypothetical protein